MRDVSKTSLLKTLTGAGIRPSAQRLEILEYISSHETHPTAEDIYRHLVQTNPTLSRTTVFNSVKLMAQKGLVNDINISPDSTRYDSADFPPHAHFLCRECGRIYDVSIDLTSLHLPSEFICDNVNIFFKGLCPECAVKAKKAP